MSQLLLLRGARQLLTLHGPEGVRRGSDLRDLSVIPDGALLVRDGVIDAVGSTRRIENLKDARRALEIDVHGSVVMPAFVDAGVNAGLNGSGSAGSRPTTFRQFHEQSLELMRSCLQHGTLTAEVRAISSAPRFDADVSVLRQLTKLNNNPVTMPRGWKISHCPSSKEELDKFAIALEIVARRRLAKIVEFIAGDRPLPAKSLLASIKDVGLVPKMAWVDGSPEALKLALSHIDPQAVGCSFGLTSAEAAILAQAHCFSVFSPGDQLDPPRANALRQIVDEGGALALSSGYDATRSPGYSMQMTISLAVIRGQLSIEEAISAATVNAAYAVGRGPHVGTLQAGKRADILVLTISDYRDIPRQFGINHVGMVLRDGNLVFNRSQWKIGAHGAFAS